MTAKSTPMWRQIAGWICLLLNVALAAIASAATFFWLVPSVNSLWLACAVSIAVAVIIMVLGARPAFPWLPTHVRITVSLIPLMFLGILVWTLFFRPMGFDYVPAQANSASNGSIDYWDLTTGSRIAYRFDGRSQPSQAHPFPVLFLHGGPGLPELPDHDVTRALNDQGFDVYGYHQFGAGLSSRATRPRDEYTVARHVDDLEAIRGILNAERLILVGQSWGGTLAANYAASHPERIESLVLTAPAPAWLPAFGVDAVRSLGRLSEEDQLALQELVSPHIARLAFRQRLMDLNPKVGDQLIGELEYAAFTQAQSRITSKTLACDPSAAQDLVVPGQAGLVNRYVFADMANLDDPRPALRGLEAPVLLMRPECDYVDPKVIQDYDDTFPQSRVVFIEGAGHEILLERKDAYLAEILNHLTGSPDSAPNHGELDETETGELP